MKYLLLNIVPGAVTEVPSPARIRKWCSVMFAQLHDAVDSYLSALHPRSANLQFDSWTAVNHHSYTAYLLRYIDEDWQFRQVHLGIARIRGWLSVHQCVFFLHPGPSACFLSSFHHRVAYCRRHCGVYQQRRWRVQERRGHQKGHWLFHYGQCCHHVLSKGKARCRECRLRCPRYSQRCF
jgi:hypothetical protein